MSKLEATAPATAPARRPRGKPDPSEAIRRVRVMQLLAMQGLLAALLLGLAFLTRDDPRTAVLLAWTLVVPAGFAYVYATAYQRHERVKKEGAWTKEWAKKQDARGYALLATVFAVWIAGALAILALV